MERKLVITRRDKSIITSTFEDDRMTTVQINKIGLSASILGNIYVARVENVVKNINAAFLEISAGVKCFYSLTDNEKHIFLNRKNNDKVNIGDLLLVQVEREAVKTKMAVATCNLNISGRKVAVNLEGRFGISSKILDEDFRIKVTEAVSPLVTDKIGFVVRTNAINYSPEEILEEAKKLSEHLELIIAKAAFRVAFSCMYTTDSECPSCIADVNPRDFDKIISDDRETFDKISSYIYENVPEKREALIFYQDKLLSLEKLYRIETHISNALKKRVWLKSGGYLIIEPTEALTVIDVNTGKCDTKKADKEGTFLKVNIEAAYEIASQIRLRNYSGIIVIDFIDLKEDENRRLLFETLKEAVKDDPVKTSVVDITKLGLVEMTRKKVKKPLHEQVDFDIENV